MFYVAGEVNWQRHLEIAFFEQSEQAFF